THTRIRTHNVRHAHTSTHTHLLLSQCFFIKHIHRFHFTHMRCPHPHTTYAICFHPSPLSVYPFSLSSLSLVYLIFPPPLFLSLSLSIPSLLPSLSLSFFITSSLYLSFS